MYLQICVNFLKNKNKVFSQKFVLRNLFDIMSCRNGTTRSPCSIYQTSFFNYYDSILPPCRDEKKQYYKILISLLPPPPDGVDHGFFLRRASAILPLELFLFSTKMFFFHVYGWIYLKKYGMASYT